MSEYGVRKAEDDGLKMTGLEMTWSRHWAECSV